MNTCRLKPWSIVLALGLVAALVISIPAARAAVTGTTRIRQGQTVYLGDTVDITGVVPPYPQLAYWDGVNMYDSTPAYIITLPVNHTGWNTFYLDPAVFATRLGAWYKYDSTIGYEPKGNNLAFVVAEPNPVSILPPVPISTSIPAITIVPTLATPLAPVPTPTPGSTPAPGSFEQENTAVIISLLIVGFVFGLFSLSESEFWKGK